MTDYTTKDFRDQTSPETRDWRGMIRRVAISLTSAGTWQVIGHLLLDGKTREVRNAEVFGGVGFHARPPAGANAEGIVAFVGGAANPHLIATRDEDTRKKVANIEQDETMAYNTQVGVKMTKDGKIAACAHGATPVGLALESELNDLRAFIMQQFSGSGHVHAVSGGATTATTPVVLPVVAPTTDYPGTDVLRGQ